jgi:hypothetical protein
MMYRYCFGSVALRVTKRGPVWNINTPFLSAVKSSLPAGRVIFFQTRLFIINTRARVFIIKSPSNYPDYLSSMRVLLKSRVFWGDAWEARLVPSIQSRVDGLYLES